MELNRYLLTEDERELKEIERDLAKHIGVPFVRCSYDYVNSHKYTDKHEMEYRLNDVEEADDTYVLDYVINYEIYSSKKDYLENEGGDDGEVHELNYLKGNGEYIVII